jgi:hypothetical protein
VADKGHSRTKSEITPQYHETRQQMRDSRHNFTIHATIPRFTPQFHDSRHKETADQSRSQYSLNSLFPAFSRNSMAVWNISVNMADNGQCIQCGEALVDFFNFC